MILMRLTFVGSELSPKQIQNPDGSFLQIQVVARVKAEVLKAKSDV